MPEPEPQPPQLRPISVERWLLMLTPSLLMLIAPIVGGALARGFDKKGEALTSAALGFMLLIVALGTALCFVLGFLLEKWRVGNLRDWSRPLGYGCLILIVNGIISFAGCAAVPSAFNI